MAWRFCVAPMLDWTTAECRLMHRALSTKARLYSEMVSTGAVIFGDAARHLHQFEDDAVALQLGGGVPDELAKATEIAQNYPYDEINLNVGCPSDRVQNNQFGACLMRHPKQVAACLRAMQKVSDKVVTVKHRLAIDEQDESQVFDFVDCVANESECRVFIVHARKAWLSGLSPKENRDIPPLRYELVYALKARFPELTIVLNGGITDLVAAKAHLAQVDGVMVGRAAYQSPALLLAADTVYNAPERSIEQALDAITAQLKAALLRGERLSDYTRHLLGLFNGQKGAKRYRQILSEQARLDGADLQVWQQALAAVGR